MRTTTLPSSRVRMERFEMHINLAIEVKVKFQVVGWGQTEKYTLSEQLLEAKMQALNHTQCYLKNRAFFKKTLRPGRNFCAAGESIKKSKISMSS
jgi:hypothetical protein